ncbi:hypothetical protein [Wenzhouxiangella marina]|uniref:Uncharacterized protein n=1 Tax=Wenzhouxiangella marina TaxID=1579979 RepID=A0A0K0XYE6_9GAMM|nr:hypothetical protein [Wenzhouxiangella marina]AKS42662.1 hypothetical protein WM2015_2299 [Wenzhouxiangella marina]MBB6088650.1 hypothetical protein [Wenzhouxiangella marina]
MAETWEGSAHTSVEARIKDRAGDRRQFSYRKAQRPLKPVAGIDANALLGMSESSYLDLVQWTGEQVHPNKLDRMKPSVAAVAPDIVWSLSRHPKAWLRRVHGTESRYYRAIGSAEALMAKAAEMRKKQRRNAVMRG